MNKAALITGCAKRIGKEIALNLASNGYDIAIHYNKSGDEAKSLQSELSKLKIKTELFDCNLENETEVEKLINKVKNKFGNLSLLINNASIFIRSNLKETTLDLFNKTININFKAPYILTRDFANQIKTGIIINILDTKISKSNFNYSIYTLTKKALADLTLMSAKELAPGIRVNGICPGLILEPEGKTSEYMDELAKNLPLKRKGSTKNITDTVLFLINNDYITGEIIYVDGGENL